MGTDEDISKLKEQTTFALSAMGIAFAQTLVEVDVTMEALDILRDKMEAMHQHLKGHGATDAAEMLETFILALDDRKLFPGERSIAR